MCQDGYAITLAAVRGGQPLTFTLEIMNQESINIRLSALRALLGNVPESLRAFSAEVSDGAIRLRSFFDESSTDSDVELLSAAGTEIIADYPDSYTLEEDFWTLSKGSEMSHLSELVFLRHEL